MLPPPDALSLRETHLAPSTSTMRRACTHPSRRTCTSGCKHASKDMQARRHPSTHGRGHMLGQMRRSEQQHSLSDEVASPRAVARRNLPAGERSDLQGEIIDYLRTIIFQWAWRSGHSRLQTQAESKSCDNRANHTMSFKDQNIFLGLNGGR